MARPVVALRFLQPADHFVERDRVGRWWLDLELSEVERLDFGDRVRLGETEGAADIGFADVGQALAVGDGGDADAAGCVHTAALQNSWASPSSKSQEWTGTAM